MVQTEFIYFVISGFLLMLLPVAFLAAFWFRGFLFPYLKVKASGGRKALIRAWNMTHWDFIPAQIIDGFVVFKVGKDNRRISVEDNQFYLMLRVHFLDIDLATNNVITRFGELKSGHDAEKTDSLLVRALMKPVPKNILLVVVLFIAILALIAAAVAAGEGFQLIKLVEALPKNGGSAIVEALG